MGGGGGVGDSEGLSLLRLSYPFTHILNKISAQFARALEGKEEKKASETFPTCCDFPWRMEMRYGM